MTALQATARLAALAEQDLPEPWIPSSDDPMIIGEFIRLEQGPTVHGPAWIVVLKTEDGKERSVWLLHTVLRNEFARHRPQPGEYVFDLTPFFGPPVMRVCGRGQHAIGGRRLLGFGS
jgi:hypothetical protein